jgi:hypothetical protein
MNYGNTELVYLASIGQEKKFATLINQPQTTPQVVKKEYTNLRRLGEIDPNHIIAPLAYFSSQEYGMYATNYIENALCIAHLNGHGIYNPMPYYHFEHFSPETSSEVNIQSIALLVNYYDQKNNR